MKLYGYWRSSAAYRVRIALNLKGIAFEQSSVHLVKDGGEQHKDDFIALNPAELVPVLKDGELILNQSMAILDYLENRYPDIALLPGEPEHRAKALAIANDVACDIHPLNNLRVLQYLSGELEVSDEQKQTWILNWIGKGFAALEARLTNSESRFCVGDSPTWADICLIPQIYNAKRFGLDMTAYPKLSEIEHNCLAIEAFKQASPEAQPDAI